MSVNNSLLFAKSIYKDSNIFQSELEMQKESIEYDACTFKLNQKSIIYRSAKITPTKVGQFVTIWKRNEHGITAPFSINDNFDLMIITTIRDNLYGQFIFPKPVLLQKGIISSQNFIGKRGMRVYPSWDVTTNKQAQKTQQWQMDYFIQFTDESSVNEKKLKLLL